MTNTVTVFSLRQAIMCQGDMALYRYEWISGNPYPHPYASMDHICVDWEVLQSWAAERSFQLGDGLLVAPDAA